MTDWLLISLLQVRQTGLKCLMDCIWPLGCSLPTPALKCDGRRFMEPWLWLTCLQVVPTLAEVCVSLCVCGEKRLWCMTCQSNLLQLMNEALLFLLPPPAAVNEKWHTCLLSFDEHRVPSVCDVCVWDACNTQWGMGVRCNNGLRSFFSFCEFYLSGALHRKWGHHLGVGKPRPGGHVQPMKLFNSVLRYSEDFHSQS